MATGDGSAASCQPDVVSPLKVAVPRSVPVLVHRWPTCVPVFDVPLWNRMALMKPLTLARNLTPTSTALESLDDALAGVVEEVQMLHGQFGGAGGPMVTGTLSDGAPMLPLSSMPRLVIVA